MTNVTARKIRDHGRERPAVGVGRVYNGFLVELSRRSAAALVIFRDPATVTRMITTPVRRVLTDPDGQVVYVETENSVYRSHVSSPGPGRAPSRLTSPLCQD